ncbi:efflux RND transporter periplasmic adaptor subunit [Chryseosolibacter indicus]|uniref:Efflux RND transporter periplasmic adaptor subunit n=1 Tax=Chryseosolibacter indicus TaxID=2782351 RepID=A0ABS5VKC8_9BACT|nr:efflux RND transporter periplasmic adaptor subunit [Chryseosolibacter indicus]MBT1701892.1 efflux RND transporter periplasmic adaptor subunit [Chryseosolibacter indicus]
MKNLLMQWARTSFNKYIYVALFGILFCCSNNEPKVEAEKKAFALSETMLNSIKLDTVKPTQVQGILNLNGKIVADENRMVEIFPIVGGNVLSIDAELGDFVKKSQTLGVIRSGEVAEYDRELTDAQSDVLVAQKNLTVKQDLYASKLVSEREIVSAQKELEKAEAALRKIKETFSIYGFNSRSEYYLKSPINGFVIDKRINRDMTLPSGHNESVFTVAELSEVWAVANVYESDISRIKEGMNVTISTLSYPGELIQGRIDKIFNVLDPETKTMKVRVRIKNQDFKLKPEMIATTRVFYNETKALPSVPASAIIFDKSRQFVMVFKDRYNIETREVELYKTTQNSAWLLSGVAPGEVVISKNQLFIYDALND